jgi:anaerobic magnesium-protoporphyrin IX monomethyl ester cyclase
MKLALIAITDTSTPARKLAQRMCPPLGLLYLKAYIEERMPATEVIWTWEAEEALASDPDIIGLSAVTENFPLAATTAQHLHARSPAPLLLGGVHISLLPGSLPPVFTAGVVGEGERTLLALLRHFSRAGSLIPEALAEIPGLVLPEEDGTVFCTQARRHHEAIDRIPFPRRSAADWNGMLHLITSRGCPYRCVFCSTSVLWGHCRLHSAERVVEELTWNRDAIAPDHVKFFDDLFIASPGRIAAIAEGVARRGLSFPGGYGAFARTDLLDEEMVGLLADMGFTVLSLGIESGSPAMLERMGKGTTVATHQRALDLCHRFGIRTCCSFVVGIPGESEADLAATLAFIDKNRDRIGEIEICPAVPLPGTLLWETASKAGRVSESMDFSLLRDASFLSEFEPDRYLYINPSMPYSLFLAYMRTFTALHADITRRAARNPQQKGTS